MADDKTPSVLFAFKAPDENTIVWPCTIKVPQIDGTHQDQKLLARFKVPTDEQLGYFFPDLRSVMQDIEQLTAKAGQAAAEGDTSAPPPARRGNAGLLDACLLGLVDVPGAGDRSEADVAQQLRGTPYVSDGLVAGCMDMVGRRLEKN